MPQSTVPIFKDLPQVKPADLANPSGFVRKFEALRETVQLVIGTRGVGRGNPAWTQQMIDSGLLDEHGVPRPGPPGSDDNSPPPLPTGFIVTPGINNVFVEWDAPTYGNGGGNSLTRIFAASQDPTSGAPDPIFTDAVLVATVPFGTQIYAMPTEPNIEWHIWIAFVSYADVEGPVAGGLHGASCTSGKLDGSKTIQALTIVNALIGNLAVDNAKIASVSAGKIIAGSIAVGEYIQSSGFVSGSLGFRISGNGNAEFNNAIFRGDIYADGGVIGGAVIDADGVESGNYVAGSAGWRLDNNTGTIYANDIVLKQGVVTDASSDAQTHAGIVWPNSSATFNPFVTTGAGAAGLSHTYRGGTLLIRADIQFNLIGGSSSIAGMEAQVYLVRKATAGGAVVQTARTADLRLAAIAYVTASAMQSSGSVALNFQYDVGDLVSGTSYYFAIYVQGVHALDSTGSQIAPGASSSFGADAYLAVSENKV